MPKETYEDFVRESLRLYPPKPPRIFVIDQTDAEALTLATEQSSQVQRIAQKHSQVSEVPIVASKADTTSYS